MSEKVKKTQIMRNEKTETPNVAIKITPRCEEMLKKKFNQTINYIYFFIFLLFEK